MGAAVTPSVVVSLIFGVMAAAMSIGAVLVGIGRVLSSLDALREESRKRGDEHAEKIDALRSDVVEAARAVSVAETRAEAMAHRVDALESEVRDLRKRVHELADEIHHRSGDARQNGKP